MLEHDILSNNLLILFFYYIDLQMHYIIQPFIQNNHNQQILLFILYKKSVHNIKEQIFNKECSQNLDINL